MSVSATSYLICSQSGVNFDNNLGAALRLYSCDKISTTLKFYYKKVANKVLEKLTTGILIYSLLIPI